MNRLGLLALAALAGVLWATVSPAEEAAAHGTWKSHTVYVDNNTSWPARAAARGVGAGSGLRLVVVSSCRGRKQCVTINYGRTSRGTVATTVKTINWDQITSARIIVNRHSTASRSRSGRAQTMCHELGHAVGLEHRSTKRSCMYRTVMRGVSTHLDGRDRSTLRRKYGR